MIRLTLQMLTDQSLNLLSPEVFADATVLSNQRIAEQLPQRPAEPLPDRHAESHLGAVDVLRRQQIREGAFEQILRFLPAQLETDWQARGEFHDLVIEERRTRFEAVRHRSDVHLDQQV